MRKVKTLFLMQSSLPLVQLWSGRLQLDAFQNTLHIQNQRSVHLSGLSVSCHLVGGDSPELEGRQSHEYHVSGATDEGGDSFGRCTECAVAVRRRVGAVSEKSITRQQAGLVKRAKRAAGTPLISLGACSGGKFVVSRAGEAYDARVRGRNRKSLLKCSEMFPTEVDHDNLSSPMLGLSYVLLILMCVSSFCAMASDPQSRASSPNVFARSDQHNAWYRWLPG